MNTLYAQFQDSLQRKDTSCLHEFKGRQFWEILNPKEKEELARLFLVKAEEVLADSTQDPQSKEEILTDALYCAEIVAPGHPILLCKAAGISLRWGLIHSNTRPLFLAWEKLKSAEKADPNFFHEYFEGYHMLGNIQVALSQHFPDAGFLEKGIEKFKKAEILLKEDPQGITSIKEFFWNFGRAWSTLGMQSGEPADFFKGIEKFLQAFQLGYDLPHFQIDYGEALMHLGLLKGDPHLLKLAVTFFKKAVTLLSSQNAASSFIFSKGWQLLAKTSRQIAEITGEDEAFKESDHLFHEAILAIPSQADLWLEWGELFLAQGWIQKNAFCVEQALEKLTSSKISECNPVTVSALLGEGLILLGFFLEDHQLLKEGEARSLETLSYAPDNTSILYVCGLSSIALGLYFSDEKHLAKAVAHFEKLLVQDGYSIKGLQGLFQAYMNWGGLTEQSWFIRKALQSISRLVELRPYSPHFWSQWGIALLRLYRIEKQEPRLLEEAISKFQKATDLRGGKGEPDWLFFQGCAYDLLGDHLGSSECYYEQAIALFSQVLEKNPHSINVQFHLALALSHYGELAADVESLYRAVDLFQKAVKPDEEDDESWCAWGYTLLLLSELILDPIHLEESNRLKSEAESKLMRAIELGNGIAFYHLACLYSLSSLFEASMNALRRAEMAGSLPSIQEIEEDEWLEALSATDAFQEFLMELKRAGDEG